MNSNENNNPKNVVNFRLTSLENSQKELTAQVKGLELWKAKVEDIIKGKTGDAPAASSSPTGKDWVKIVILALTIISALVAVIASGGGLPK